MHQYQIDRASGDPYGERRRAAERVSRGEPKVRPSRAAYAAKYRAQLRTDALAAYGGKCACCKESEQAFLVIDHTENNGAAHRREIRPNGPRSATGVFLYRWLKKNGYPPGFQTLCANCNTAKMRGTCPHQL